MEMNERDKPVNRIAGIFVIMTWIFVWLLLIYFIAK